MAPETLLEAVAFALYAGDFLTGSRCFAKRDRSSGMTVELEFEGDNTAPSIGADSALLYLEAEDATIRFLPLP